MVALVLGRVVGVDGVGHIGAHHERRAQGLLESGSELALTRDVVVRSIRRPGPVSRENR